MVEAQPSYDNDEPEPEGPRFWSHVCTKPAAPVLSQVVQHECVAVHDGVVVAAQRTHDPENLVGIGTDEAGPRVIARRLGRSMKNRRQLRGGHCGHADSLVGHVHDLVLSYRA